MPFTAEQKTQYFDDIDTIFADEKQRSTLLEKLRNDLANIEISTPEEFDRMWSVHGHLEDHLEKSSLDYAPFEPLLELISIQLLPEDRNNSLLRALDSRNDAAIHLLIQIYKLNINAPWGGKDLSLLHLMTISGQLKIVEYLVDVVKADVNTKDEAGYTPLHYAALHDRLEIIEFLLTRKATVNALSIYHQSPLHTAASHGRLEICKLLVSAGANIDIRTIEKVPQSPLDCAFNTRKFDVLQWLMDDPKFKRNETALHIAAQINDKEMVKYLLEHKADVNALTANGRTPLHMAALRADLETCKLLIDNGANINAQSTNGDTPLHIALDQNNLEKAKLLLQAGARLDIRKHLEANDDESGSDDDNEDALILNMGPTPMEIAEENKKAYPNMLQLLKNFTRNETIIDAIHQVVKPTLAEALEGLLLSDLQSIIFGTQDQKNTAKQDGESPEIKKNGYLGLPEGKIIEVAEQYLLDFAKKNLPIRREKERLEKELAEQKDEQGKESLNINISALKAKIKDLTDLTAKIIALVPDSTDCQLYWDTLQTKNTIDDLEKVQRPSKLPELTPENAKTKDDAVAPKSATSTASLNKEEKIAATVLKTDIDPSILDPAEVSGSGSFRSSSSISSSDANPKLQAEHSRFAFAGKGVEKGVAQVKILQPAGPNG